MTKAKTDKYPFSPNVSFGDNKRYRVRNEDIIKNIGSKNNINIAIDEGKLRG